MFDSLPDRMKQDDAAVIGTRERIARYTLVAIVSVILFGGLYIAIKMLE